MNDNDIWSFLQQRYSAELSAAATEKTGGRRPASLRRPPPLEEQPALYAGSRIMIRAHAITSALVKTIDDNRDAVWDAHKLLAKWMQGSAIVRVLGAGRALLAASLAGNRLAHGGAQVSFMSGMVPMPNSLLGGGIIAASASGKTRAVLDAMRIAKINNPMIETIGIADRGADEFAALCDVFIGIHEPVVQVPDPLSALADQEELLIAEILDAVVVLAGESIGFDDESWRRGHEDIGPTGPYGPSPTSPS